MVLLMDEKTPITDTSANAEASSAPAASPSRAARFAAETFDWVQTFCQALFAVVILFTFLFRFVTVDGHSMDETLADRDRLVISDIAYTPERGDIVVIHDTETEIVQPVIVNAETGETEYRRVPAFRGPIIKRIIATEGETVVVDYDNWQITVTDINGVSHVLEEPYVNFERMTAAETLVPLPVPNRLIYPRSVGHLEEHVVAEGCVFVCGDNRAHSLDSRYVGDIDARKILGKALWRVFPFTSFGPIEHVDYEIPSVG